MYVSCMLASVVLDFRMFVHLGSSDDNAMFVFGYPCAHLIVSVECSDWQVHHYCIILQDFRGLHSAS